MVVSKGFPEKLRWFNEARFGMFVHFGLYALLGRGEWVMYNEQIPREEYEQLVGQFHPHRFDADQWVSLAEQAGAKYIAVTAKHHDGFCLFDSALTEFKITNTPFKRDLIGELIAACQRRGMRIVIYYSQPDWHHPQYVHQAGAFKDLTQPRPGDRPDWPAYVRYYMGQVEELCTKYGKIDGIWFDGSHKSIEEWKGKEVYELIKKHQPHAVVNDRARYGDFFTPERSLPDDLTGYMFEACDSVSPTAWGYRDAATCYTVPYLVRSLARMTCYGGNYLLNVGPLPDGTVPVDQAQVMRRVGHWLSLNGGAVYGSEPVFLAAPLLKKTRAMEPLKASFGATMRDNQLFVHFLDWPESSQLFLLGIRSKVTAVRLLGSGEAIPFRQSEHTVELYELPSLPPDPLVQILELSFAETPNIQQAVRAEKPVPVIELAAEGATALLPEQADMVGRAVKGTKLQLLKERSGQTVLWGWMVPGQEARWKLDCSQGGAYRVIVTAAGEPEAVMHLTAGNTDWLIDMPGAGDAGNFTSIEAGIVHLEEGEVVVSIRPERLQWGYRFGKVAHVVLERCVGGAEQAQ